MTTPRQTVLRFSSTPSAAPPEIIPARNKRKETISTSNVANELLLLGPQRRGEPQLLRRIRFHQSWYRLKRLGIKEYGSTPGRRGSPLGSILPAWAASRQLNFLSNQARELYEHRKALGWGIDPVRCTSHLTSSQALVLNLFGPLWSFPEWTSRIISTLFVDLPTVQQVCVQVEYAPSWRREVTGNATIVDALIEIETAAGKTAVIVEVKYADRFNSRLINVDSEFYRNLVNKTEFWTEPDVLQDKHVNQLLRCHALGIVGCDSYAIPPKLLVIHHADDNKASEVFSIYQRKLADKRTACAISIASLINVMKDTAIDPEHSALAERLEARYKSEPESSGLWQHYLDSLC